MKGKRADILSFNDIMYVSALLPVVGESRSCDPHMSVM